MSELAYCLLNPIGVDDDADGAVPKLAGIKNEISGVVEDFPGRIGGVDFVGVFALVPDQVDSVACFEFGQVVKRVEVAKSIGPADITPSVGRQNNRQARLLWSAKIGDTPDTRLENFFPVGPLVNLSAQANFVNYQAVFGGERGIEVG